MTSMILTLLRIIIQYYSNSYDPQLADTHFATHDPIVLFLNELNYPQLAPHDPTVLFLLMLTFTLLLMINQYHTF